MDIKSILAIAIQLIGILFPTPTTAITAITKLLTALQSSPALLDWLQSLIAKQQTIPNGALGEIAPDDAELKAAFNKSPAMQEWANSPHEHGAAENISLGGISAFLQFLPQIIALINAFKKTS